MKNNVNSCCITLPFRVRGARCSVVCAVVAAMPKSRVAKTKRKARGTRHEARASLSCNSVKACVSAQLWLSNHYTQSTQSRGVQRVAAKYAHRTHTLRRKRDPRASNGPFVIRPNYISYLVVLVHHSRLSQVSGSWVSSAFHNSAAIP